MASSDEVTDYNSVTCIYHVALQRIAPCKISNIIVSLGCSLWANVKMCLPEKVCESQG